MTRIGFIGVGELALYTIKGVRRGGYQGPVLLSPRNREKAKYLAAKYDCEVKPDNETLRSLEFKPDQVLISVVAGIEVEQLRTALSTQVEIVRAMPVSSAEAGASPTLIYPDNAFVREFFDYCGNSIAVDNEIYFNQGSVLACVYCWFFSLFEELIQSTRGPALPADLSAELVMGMAKGAAELALANKDISPGEIAGNIATEGTFSRLGLDLLEENAAFKPWGEACELLQKQLAAND
jgi:pyrroline-5-carboxylate reductase